MEQTDWLIKTAKLKREDLTLHTANSFTTLVVLRHVLTWCVLVVCYTVTASQATPNTKTMAFKTQVAVVTVPLKGTTVGYDETYTLNAIRVWPICRLVIPMAIKPRVQ